jgi:glutaminyl-peptide cyclotransferase
MRSSLTWVTVRPLFAVLGVQLALGVIFAVLVVSGALPLDGDAKPGAGAARVNRFDGAAAWRLLKMQVAYGPRPAGSQASRKLAGRLKGLLPHGRYQTVPGGLRNVVGTVPGRDPRRYVVVGAHYDTKAIPGFVGANDGAGGTAELVQLARRLRPRTIGPTVVFIAFDGEESPGPGEGGDFYAAGLRGSKVAAKAYRHAQAMILLDFVADKQLSLPREGSSDPKLWGRLRAAAKQAAVGSYFPDASDDTIYDDHTPFQRSGVPAIDLIDWDFPCWHKACDDLSAVSERSLDASGEAMAGLLRTLR